MAFGFISGHDNYRSLQSLVNKNNGLFVSDKQANFWLNKLKREIYSIKCPENENIWSYIQECMGFAKFNSDVELPLETYLVECYAHTHFGKSHNNITYIFIVDAKGVYAKYKFTEKKGMVEEFKADRDVFSLKQAFDTIVKKEAEERKKKIQELLKKGITIPNNERVEIKGTIERIYPHHGVRNRMVMLIQTDYGYKTWGTVPEKMFSIVRDYRLIWKDLIGAEITFHATVVQSEKDSLFTFFNRPAQVAIDEESLAWIILRKEY